jgi:hypothetical protein
VQGTKSIVSCKIWSAEIEEKKKLARNEKAENGLFVDLSASGEMCALFSLLPRNGSIAPAKH